MRTALQIICFAALAGSAYAQEAADASGGLTLEQALSQALLHNPQLAATEYELEAAEARVVQAGLRPNPDLSVQLEDIRIGSGPAPRTRSGSVSVAPESGGFTPGASIGAGREEGGPSGLDEAELNIVISQVFELAGKRQKRAAAAEREVDVVRWDIAIDRSNLMERVTAAFFDTLAAQERLSAHNDLVNLADQVSSTITARVEAGKVSPLEGKRARVELARAQIGAERAKRELAARRAALAATWGDEEARFESVRGAWREVPALPAYDDLRESIEELPDLQRWAAELERRDAVINLELARRIPNLEVALGFRSKGVRGRGGSGWEFGTGGLALSRSDSGFDEGREESLILEARIGLPLFDRNQGNIAEAEARFRQVHEEQRAARISAASALRDAYELASAAYDEATRLQDEVIPLSRETFMKTQEAYRQGKFGYLDVLAAESQLFELRMDLLDSLNAYHRNVVRIQRLSGGLLFEAEDLPSGED